MLVVSLAWPGIQSVRVAGYGEAQAEGRAGLPRRSSMRRLGLVPLFYVGVRGLTGRDPAFILIAELVVRQR
jgi:hypothetical protein